MSRNDQQEDQEQDLSTFEHSRPIEPELSNTLLSDTEDSHQNLQREPLNQPRYQPSNQYQHFHVNEAVALESMIDSDVYGKLKDVFQDSDLEAIHQQQQHIIHHSNSSTSMIDSLNKNNQQEQSSLEGPFQYNSRLEYLDPSPIRQDSYTSPLGFSASGRSSDPHISHEKEHQAHQEPPSPNEQSYHQTHREDPESVHEATYLGSREREQPQSYQQQNMIENPSSQSERLNSPSPLAKSKHLTSSRKSSMPEIKSLNIEANPTLIPDVDDEFMETSDSPVFLSDTPLTNRSRKKYKPPKGGTCHICDKVIKRDLVRHLRTHEDVGRFKCIFPRKYCTHKTGFFNRQYDYKKHLLHSHFTFDDESAKKLHNLNEKLLFRGKCGCEGEFVADDWLNDHILTLNLELRCPKLKQQLEEDDR